MPYQSNARAVKAAIRQGIDDGLTVIGQHYTQNVRGVLLSGYTSGAFSNHARGVAGRVMFTPPRDMGDGSRGIIVGTSTAPGYPYELAWELGHQNLFTGRFERVEVWNPMLEDNAWLYLRMMHRSVERRAGAEAARVVTLSVGRATGSRR